MTVRVLGGIRGIRDKLLLRGFRRFFLFVTYWKSDELLFGVGAPPSAVLWASCHDDDDGDDDDVLVFLRKTRVGNRYFER